MPQVGVELASGSLVPIDVLIDEMDSWLTLPMPCLRNVRLICSRLH